MLNDANWIVAQKSSKFSSAKTTLTIMGVSNNLVLDYIFDDVVLSSKEVVVVTDDKVQELLVFIEVVGFVSYFQCLHMLLTYCQAQLMGIAYIALLEIVKV